jgi:membrane fusion protein (multidrug efflux system)|nr:efflux RND transporter periplasmic adaptor subunit [Burkholderia sp. lig30]
MRDYILLAIVLLLLVAAAIRYVFQIHTERTEDAYVDGNAVQVTSQISGTVIAILADDTDHIESGSVLVRLNPVDQEVQFERASAALAKATRAARGQYHDADQLQAEVDQRRNDVEKAKADLGRRTLALPEGAVSREEISHAQDAYRNAQAALEASRQALAQRQAVVDGTTLRTNPDVLSAAANVRDAYIARVRTQILAPVSGTVTKRSAQVGERISPGSSLMSVVPLDALWVTANFKESQLEDLRIGQPVELTADAYGGDVTYHGKIVGVDAGTGSAFALLPPQNATGNWIKVTQRVPVRITLDPREIAPHPLRIGLSMRVIVDTHDRSGSVLRRGTSTPSAYETRVFDAELKNANDVVDTIIRKNEGGSPRSSNAPAMRQEMRDAS